MHCEATTGFVQFIEKSLSPGQNSISMYALSPIKSFISMMFVMIDHVALYYTILMCTVQCS